MCLLAIQKEISQGNITDICLCCFDQVFFWSFLSQKKKIIKQKISLCILILVLLNRVIRCAVWGTTFSICAYLCMNHPAFAMPVLSWFFSSVGLRSEETCSSSQSLKYFIIFCVGQPVTTSVRCKCILMAWHLTQLQQFGIIHKPREQHY